MLNMEHGLEKKYKPSIRITTLDSEESIGTNMPMYIILYFLLIITEPILF